MSSTPQTQDGGVQFTRRNLMRTGVAGGVAMLGIGVGTQRSQAVAPLIGAGAIGAAAKAGALGYLAYEGAQMFLGDDEDLEGYTGELALANRIAEGSTDIQITEESVFTSIDNNVQMLDNLLLSKGKIKIVEAFEEGVGLSEAEDRVEDLVNEHVADIEENILNTYKSHWNQIWHYAELVDEHEDLSLNAQFNGYRFDGNEILDIPTGDVSNWVYGTVELSDGREFEEIPTAGYNGTYDDDMYPAVEYASQHGHDSGNSNDHVGDGVVEFSHSDTDTDIDVLNGVDIYNLVSSLLSQRDSIISDLHGIADDIYSAWEPGDEPDTSEWIDPITAATELSQDYDGHTAQSAHAAFLGIPTAAEESLVIEIEDPETNDVVTVDADIYTTHVPTDGDGNEVGFEVGEQYDPDTWDEPIYISYEYLETNEDGEITEEYQEFESLELPFTVTEAYDSEGEEVQSFQVESTNTQTTDLEELEAEMEQIRDEEQRLLAEAQEQQDDGFWGGIGDGGFGAYGGIAFAALGLGALYKIADMYLPN